MTHPILTTDNVTKVTKYVTIVTIHHTKSHPIPLGTYSNTYKQYLSATIGVTSVQDYYRTTTITTTIEEDVYIIGYRWYLKALYCTCSVPSHRRESDTVTDTDTVTVTDTDCNAMEKNGK